MLERIAFMKNYLVDNFKERRGICTKMIIKRDIYVKINNNKII